MIYLVAGTRPNFMKIAPSYRALAARGAPTRLLHTGQHFDAAMSDVFFRDLGLPAPDVTLRAGGGFHEQTRPAHVDTAARRSPPRSTPSPPLRGASRSSFRYTRARWRAPNRSASWPACTPRPASARSSLSATTTS